MVFVNNLETLERKGDQVMTVAGFPSLISDKPGTTLPHLTLASTIHGMERIQHVIVQLSHSTICDKSLGVCPREGCALNVGVYPMEQRMEALKKIFAIMVNKSKGDVLSPLSLGDPLCISCAKVLEDTYLCYCEKFVWVALPSLVWGWEESGRFSIDGWSRIK